MKPDILNVIDSKDMNPKERVSFEDKNLSEMTLPEHARILDEMLSVIEENEDLTEEEKNIVDKINLSANQKALAWGWVIKNVQEAQQIIDNENKFYAAKIQENKNRIAVLQNRINSRSDYLEEIMNKLGKKKIEGPNYLVRLKKQTQKVELKTDLEKIEYSKYPGCFKEIPKSFQPIKAEMKNWLKTNESEDFALTEIEFKLEVK